MEDAGLRQDNGAGQSGAGKPPTPSSAGLSPDCPDPIPVLQRGTRCKSAPGWWHASDLSMSRLIDCAAGSIAAAVSNAHNVRPKLHYRASLPQAGVASTGLRRKTATIHQLSRVRKCRASPIT
ncbi:hypothetical protein CPLU01_02765 [Colletotrichum plurivorum]|uniref:Uncharacterized protein n=1 Tax=Colletotrichum plurivorum TaxID=2175906 RepID=A0A8H6KUG2_9PEZI|nr:hypothetical protein CPLU01_02765 [Colletotrichum plurivorum]